MHNKSLKSDLLDMTFIILPSGTLSGSQRDFAAAFIVASRLRTIFLFIAVLASGADSELLKW